MTTKHWTEKAAEEIMSDLGGRAGIGNEIDALDDEIRDEILTTITKIIADCHYHSGV